MKALTLIKQSFSTKHLKKVSLRKHFTVFGLRTLLDQKHIFYYKGKNCINATIIRENTASKRRLHINKALFRLVFTTDGVRVGVVIRNVEHYDLVKTAF